MSEKIVIKDKQKIFPMVPTRDLVVFPGMSVQFDVGRSISIKGLKNALKTDYVFLCPQKEIEVERPQKEELYKIGTLAKVSQLVKGSDGFYRCFVEGVRKAKLVKLLDNGDCYEAQIKLLPNYGEEKLNDIELEAVQRRVIETFEEYAGLVPQMPGELYTKALCAKTPEKLFEAIVFNIPLSFYDRQSMQEISSAGEKLVLLLTILTREIDVISIDMQIREQVRDRIEEGQREFMIKEQIKALQAELNDNDDEFSENQDLDITGYRLQIGRLAAPEETKHKLEEEVVRLTKMPPASQEAALIRGYLDTVLGLPWGNSTTDRTDITKARQILDKDHYGLQKVKERILESLAVRAIAPDVKGQILCLAGPPGVGKTSVAKSVARALNRRFVRVSLGGVRDESDIRGHRKTYVGAMPGRIINAMKQAGSKNPVMLLDEIDKMGNDFRGDPSSAMLEVLDAEQNDAFRDHYIEVPFDLSEVLFITTANTLDTIAAPLLDRMEIIELSSYTREEKFNIAKKHIVKKQLAKHGLKASQMRINNDGIYKLIDSYTREAGVRKLEQTIASLCRKAAKEIVENQVAKVTFNGKNIPDYLGHEKYLPDDYSKKDCVGCVNGLAWTSVGGVIMPLEVLVLDGKGKVQLTGSLGDVMKESASIAVSYCRSIADKYNIEKDFYEKKDLHIHAPEGAVPKDGPSAGVTMVTAIVSALSGLKVRSDVAMTGEITLTGKVLPIGGLREKTMAAYKAGMKTVIIPFANKGDLDEVDDVVKQGLEFVYAKKIQDVLDVAVIKENKTARKTKSSDKANKSVEV